MSGSGKEIPMELDTVEVRGLIDIREQKNHAGKDIVTELKSAQALG